MDIRCDLQCFGQEARFWITINIYEFIVLLISSCINIAFVTTKETVLTKLHSLAGCSQSLCQHRLHHRGNCHSYAMTKMCTKIFSQEDWRVTFHDGSAGMWIDLRTPTAVCWNTCMHFHHSGRTQYCITRIRVKVTIRPGISGTVHEIRHIPGQYFAPFWRSSFIFSILFHLPDDIFITETFFDLGKFPNVETASLLRMELHTVQM